MVQTIQKKIAAGEYTHDTTVAMLYRTNAQSRLLEEACVKHNLPYVILGKATSFYKRREVKDCLCFLRWIYNGRDKVSMVRAFQTPSRGLGDKAVEQFQSYCELVAESCQRLGRPPPTPLQILLSFLEPEEEGLPLRSENIATRPLKLFKEFAYQMKHIYKIAEEEPVEKLLASVIDEFGIMAHLDKISDSKTEFEERQGNVLELQHATRRYTKDGPSLQYPSPETTDIEDFRSPLGAMLDDVALVTESAEERNEGKNGDRKRFVVSLMTIHASKGMEFDSVFVTGNEQGTFPTSQAVKAGPSSVTLAEECRLCYVAITRAKTELFLTWRRESAVFDSDAPRGFSFVTNERSQFLDSLMNKRSTKNKTEPQQQKREMTTSARSRSTKPQQQRRLTTTARPTRLDGYEMSNDSNGNLDVRSMSRYSRRNPVTLEGREQRNTQRGSSSRTVQKKQQPKSLKSMTPLELEQASSSSRSKTRVAKQPISGIRNRTPTQRQALPRSPQRQQTQRQASMDSTWFFPIGSKVIHRQHGRGLVMNPAAVGSLRVLVKFEDGQQLDFPAQGDELRREH